MPSPIHSPPRSISAIVLAGGMSKRMGRDKALLEYGGQPSICLIVEEIAQVSNEIVVVIGSKRASRFAKMLPSHVSVLPDSYRISNPLGGMLSGFDYVKTTYAAVLACDLPLVKHNVVKFISLQAFGHSAAVPIWENGDTEPLCAVYRVTDARKAALETLAAGQNGPRQILPFLSDVHYVPVSQLRRFDPALDSLLNVNTEADHRRARLRYRSRTKRVSSRISRVA